MQQAVVNISGQEMTVEQAQSMGLGPYIQEGAIYYIEVPDTIDTSPDSGTPEAPVVQAEPTVNALVTSQEEMPELSTGTIAQESIPVTTVKIADGRTMSLEEAEDQGLDSMIVDQWTENVTIPSPPTQAINQLAEAVVSVNGPTLQDALTPIQLQSSPVSLPTVDMVTIAGGQTMTLAEAQDKGLDSYITDSWSSTPTVESPLTQALNNSLPAVSGIDNITMNPPLQIYNPETGLTTNESGEVLTQKLIEAIQPATPVSKSWADLGFPQYEGKYNPVTLPTLDSYIKSITEIQDNPNTPEIESGLSVIFGNKTLDDQETINKNFYEAIGYPQYSGKYEPITIPEGYQISSLTETPTGLQPQFIPTAQLTTFLSSFESSYQKGLDFNSSINQALAQVNSPLTQTVQEPDYLNIYGNKVLRSEAENYLMASPDYTGEQIDINQFPVWEETINPSSSTQGYFTPSASILNNLALQLETPEALNAQQTNIQQKEVQAQSENFYNAIGYPQFAGKYVPIEIPQDALGNPEYIISALKETPTGLQASFAPTSKLQSWYDVLNDRLAGGMNAGDAIRSATQAMNPNIDMATQSYWAPSLDIMNSIFEAGGSPAPATKSDIATELYQAGGITALTTWASQGSPLNVEPLDIAKETNTAFWTAQGLPQLSDFKPVNIPEGYEIGNYSLLNNTLTVSYKPNAELQATLDSQKASYDAQVKASKDFYTAIGFPQLGGVQPNGTIYLPLTGDNALKAGEKVTNITVTPSGDLQVSKAYDLDLAYQQLLSQHLIPEKSSPIVHQGTSTSVPLTNDQFLAQASYYNNVKATNPDVARYWEAENAQGNQRLLDLGMFMVTPLLPFGGEIAGIASAESVTASMLAGIGITQGITAITQQRIITPEEALQSAFAGGVLTLGTGALFQGIAKVAEGTGVASDIADTILGKVTTTGPDAFKITAPAVEGALARTSIVSGIGAVSGYALSGGNVDSAIQGAEFGALLGGVTELYGLTVGPKLYEYTQGKVTSLADEVTKLNMEEATTSSSPDRYTGELSTTDKLLVKITGAQPKPLAEQIISAPLVEELRLSNVKQSGSLPTNLGDTLGSLDDIANAPKVGTSQSEIDAFNELIKPTGYAEEASLPTSLGEGGASGNFATKDAYILGSTDKNAIEALQNAWDLLSSSPKTSMVMNAKPVTEASLEPFKSMFTTTPVLGLTQIQAIQGEVNPKTFDENAKWSSDELNLLKQSGYSDELSTNLFSKISYELDAKPLPLSEYQWTGGQMPDNYLFSFETKAPEVFKPSDMPANYVNSFSSTNTELPQLTSKDLLDIMTGVDTSTIEDVLSSKDVIKTSTPQETIAVSKLTDEQILKNVFGSQDLNQVLTSKQATLQSQSVEQKLQDMLTQSTGKSPSTTTFVQGKEVTTAKTPFDTILQNELNVRATQASDAQKLVDQAFQVYGVKTKSPDVFIQGTEYGGFYSALDNVISIPKYTPLTLKSLPSILTTSFQSSSKVVTTDSGKKVTIAQQEAKVISKPVQEIITIHETSHALDNELAKTPEGVSILLKLGIPATVGRTLNSEFAPLKTEAEREANKIAEDLLAKISPQKLPAYKKDATQSLLTYTTVDTAEGINPNATVIDTIIEKIIKEDTKKTLYANAPSTLVNTQDWDSVKTTFGEILIPIPPVSVTITKPKAKEKATETQQAQDVIQTQEPQQTTDQILDQILITQEPQQTQGYETTQTPLTENFWSSMVKPKEKQKVSEEESIYLSYPRETITDLISPIRLDTINNILQSSISEQTQEQKKNIFSVPTQTEVQKTGTFGLNKLLNEVSTPTDATSTLNKILNDATKTKPSQVNVEATTSTQRRDLTKIFSFTGTNSVPITVSDLLSTPIQKSEQTPKTTPATKNANSNPLMYPAGNRTNQKFSDLLTPYIPKPPSGGNSGAGHGYTGKWFTKKNPINSAEQLLANQLGYGTRKPTASKSKFAVKTNIGSSAITKIAGIKVGGSLFSINSKLISKKPTTIKKKKTKR